ncbi:type II toxin-antitoxin system ParD family antitoxin [Rhizobium sp. 9T]|uniref:Type II toxin-antitoxin system ParD family antitoxin n=1 Tax=Rhizobium croatiense TaxID=2867516 RepID=A0ABS7LUH5_9HYPH|nr:type II toxin-antitoxin system ParD family antitoxin [Rhizobium croatiense]MBY4607624.1 type II toxin-antitoxin system ParD family antitoxin [Rhizobium croatiense]MBY4628500.1 type II toxin-antitoxin system ParD family antitoxin [Rhizobium croatiense]
MTTIRLNAAEEAFIEQQIKAGYYDNANDVVQAALELLREREAKIVKLRALIQEGQHDIETGRLVSFDSAEELTALILQAAAETDN